MDVDHLHIGTVLNEVYVIDEVLQSQQFYNVYVAHDLQRPESKLMIQEFYLSGIVSRKPGSNLVYVFFRYADYQFEEGLKTFLKESLLMKGLNDIEGIMGYVDVFVENSTAYRVSDLMNDTENLASILWERGKFSEERTLTICFQLMNIMQKMHNRHCYGMLFCPEDIILKGNKVYLSNSYFEHILESEYDVASPYEGYMAQEVCISGSKKNESSDVYFVGALAYKMLTGKKPMDSVTRRWNDKPLNPRLIDLTISKRTSQAIMKALALDVEKRFHSMGEFEMALMGTFSIS